MEEFRQYCLETGNIEEFAALNTPQKLGIFERVGRVLCAIIRHMIAGSGFSLFM